MTDAPKIDTQAPALNIAFGRDNSELPQGWTLHLGDGVVHYRKGNSASSYGLEQGLRAYLATLADLADARAAAAAQAMREAAESVCDTDVQKGGWECRDEIAALPLPNPAALDRLIAERVREARNTAWDEAADIMDGYGQHGYAEEFRARICAARGSKDGRS